MTRRVAWRLAAITLATGIGYLIGATLAHTTR